MKKSGFTLAEILIALAIVGVIAALTIPSVVSSNKNQANATKLATTISALENAFTSMIVTETVNDLTETEFAANPSAATLGKYLKINTSNMNNSLQIYGYDAKYNGGSFSTLSGGSTSIPMNISFQLKNGAIIMYNDQSDVQLNETIVKNMGGTVTGRQGYVVIDVNGKELPNTWGRDAFGFMLGIDGLLYPCGGINYSILLSARPTNTWDASNGDEGCNDNIKSIGCTARLIENNFKIDY